MRRLFLFNLFLIPTLLVMPPLPRLLASSPVELVVVCKSARTMQLLAGGEVIRSYHIALGRSPVGPKQQAGDCRTPEGSYLIDHRNSKSKFYKSLHISYPNRRDLAVSSKRGTSPGGDIMIHGLPQGFDDMADYHYRINWTKGCIAVNNAEMDEIWQLVGNGTPIIIKP